MIARITTAIILMSCGWAESVPSGAAVGGGEPVAAGWAFVGAEEHVAAAFRAGGGLVVGIFVVGIWIVDIVVNFVGPIFIFVGVPIVAWHGVGSSILRFERSVCSAGGESVAGSISRFPGQNHVRNEHNSDYRTLGTGCGIR